MSARVAAHQFERRKYRFVCVGTLEPSASRKPAMSRKGSERSAYRGETGRYRRRRLFTLPANTSR
jgi:hypothetical protein